MTQGILVTSTGVATQRQSKVGRGVSKDVTVVEYIRAKLCVLTCMCFSVFGDGGAWEVKIPAITELWFVVHPSGIRVIARDESPSLVEDEPLLKRAHGGRHAEKASYWNCAASTWVGARELFKGTARATFDDVPRWLWSSRRSFSL